MFKYFICTVYIIVSFVILLPTSAYALNIHYPEIPAPIPGGSFDLDCLEKTGEKGIVLDPTHCSSPYTFQPSVNNIILFIFVTAIWIGSIIAFVVLVYTGFTFIFSGENPGIRYKAKERLTNVIWGMLILLLSTVSLRLINPDITDLKEPGLKSVEAGKGWKLTLPGLKVKGGGEGSNRFNIPPGTILGKAGWPFQNRGQQIIGRPGQGTHSWTNPPNNWQSDNAIDIAVPIGTPILAVESGVIGPQLGYVSPDQKGRFAGQRFTLISDDGNSWYYTHLNSFVSGIAPGVPVRAGQIIGYSGEANGVQHLHIASHYGDPQRLLGI